MCGRDSLYSLVGKKLHRKNCKKHMIEASLEFGLHYGHLNFNFLNGIESTNKVYFLNPNNQKMYRYLT